MESAWGANRRKCWNWKWDRKSTIGLDSPLTGVSMKEEECLAVNREIKIHVYGKRQTSDSSWEFLRIENKLIKTVQKDLYG